MNTTINMKVKATKYLLVFLILSQLSNAFLVTDLLISRDNVALSNDIDNSAKEDKNTFDGEEESKILEGFFNPIKLLYKTNRYDFFVQKFTEILKTEDFPPPERYSLT